MVLRDFVSPSTTALGCRAVNWEDAIRQAGYLLEEAGDIQAEYTQAMVNMVKNLGPYIVMMPGVALAHARPEGKVMRNSIAAVTFPEGVIFGSKANDPVYLVFALAACTDNEHLDLFRELAGFIENNENVERLIHATTYEEIGF